MMQKCYYTDFIPPCGDFIKDGKTEFLNMGCAFDIETTSFKVNEDKFCTMYLWQFAVTSKCACYGRTWEEFLDFMKTIEDFYKLGKNRKMIVYVHNLGFECQFLKSVIKIDKVFANSPRKPMYFTYRNFIFKDSLILSGLSLRRTLEECRTPIEISKTTLDYTLKRHSKTPLNDNDITYGLNDVLGLAYYIETEIKKNENDITKIPLTKTGYARRFVRERCFEDDSYKKHIDNMQITDENLYRVLTDAFAGGYTHANPCYVGAVFDNVGSIDFTSSYPSVMIRKKYPCGKFSQLNLNVEYLDKMLERYACVFRVKFTKIRARDDVFVHIISESHCRGLKRPIVDNGRIVCADFLETCVTDVDFQDIRKFYTFDSFEIYDFWYAPKDYLPKPFIECILELYENKTKLKGVEGKEDLYLVSKGILNSMYGMCVTSIQQDNYLINEDGEWELKPPPPVTECLKKNAKSKRTFLVYSTGVWVTAWARHELFKGIFEMELNEDFIYSDTDSIKFLNYNRYDDWIADYNKKCKSELDDCLNKYGIDTRKTNPDGKHPLGVWDFEGVYDKFKTLGCKRYLYTTGSFERSENEIGFWSKCNPRRFYRLTPIFKRDSQKFHLTVAGLNKVEPVDYIIKHGAFDFFNDDMVIPSEYSGRLTHCYIDEQTPVFLYDYLGNKFMCTDKSGIYLEQSEYHMNLHDIFIQYLTGIKNADTQRVDNILKERLNEWQATAQNFSTLGTT